MKMMWKILAPLIAILAGVVIATVLIISKPEVEPEPIVTPAKSVEILIARKSDISVNVISQGSVEPRTESALVSQVAGRVIRIAPAFVAGGFFAKGDTLVRIDPRDYELTLIQARAQVAQAERRYQVEQEESAAALREWERLGKGAAPPLVARTPQLAEARAALEAAKASQQLAALNLERTKITAPYSGRIRAKNVDVGQYVAPGAAIAVTYAVDYAEVRLPLPDEDLAYLNIPDNFMSARSGAKGPDVVVRGRYAGRANEWQGYLTRIEGEIDPRSRMIHVVARIEDPYGKRSAGDIPPLTVGMFVEAEIVGITLDSVVALPRAALRDNDRVLIVDSDERLQYRDVEIVRREAQRVLVRAGLDDGDRVCVSTLEIVAEGMSVQIVSTQQRAAAAPGGE